MVRNLTIKSTKLCAWKITEEHYLAFWLVTAEALQTSTRPLQDLLDEYSAWNSIQMIISDTTAVNTGRKNGVVARLQRTFLDKGLKNLDT